MSGTVTRMAEIREDNNLVTPEQTLEDALSAIRSGVIKPRSLLVLAIDGDDISTYDVRWFASRLRTSEMVSLCEIAKSHIARSMGY